MIGWRRRIFIVFLKKSFSKKNREQMKSVNGTDG